MRRASGRGRWGGGGGLKGAPLFYQKGWIKTTSYVKQSVFDFCLQLQSSRKWKNIYIIHKMWNSVGTFTSVIQVQLRKIPKSVTNVRCTVDVLVDLWLGVVVVDLTSYTIKSWFFSRKDSLPGQGFRALVNLPLLRACICRATRRRHCPLIDSHGVCITLLWMQLSFDAEWFV